MKKDFDINIADNYTDEYWKYLVEVNKEDIKKAMNFRRNNKKFSAPDAIGYIIAKRLGIKFLTGDEGFRNFENVEFVKK